VADLFSIALSAALSSAASWATKHALDAIAGCPASGSEHSRSISDCATNNFVCSLCENKLDQYLIAAPGTVCNGRLMGANIFNPHWEAQIQGWMFKNNVGNWFLLDINTVGMQHDGVVLKGSFRDVKSDKVWPAPDIYLNNDRERTTHQRMGWRFDPYTILNYTTVVADIIVQTLEGDVLHSIAPIATFTPGGRGY
jgi:hypothetical protein